MRPNQSFQGTAGKLRLPVPSALRAPATPELKRWASDNRGHWNTKDLKRFSRSIKVANLAFHPTGKKPPAGELKRPSGHRYAGAAQLTPR